MTDLARCGTKNPNWKNAGWHTCQTCGASFHNYNKTRKYCSLSCAAQSTANLQKLANLAPTGRPKKPRPPCQACGARPVCTLDSKHCGNPDCAKATRKQREKKAEPSVPSPNKTCAHCGKAYHSYNKTRIYCSYPCHLESGGAFRAGLASKRAVMRYGAKKDANHAEVFDEMRKHCAVYDFSTAGHGLPDGIAWVAGQWRLFDVKNPKSGYGRRGLNQVQKKWLAQWKGGPVYLIHSAEEAARFGRGELDGIKFVTPEGAADALRAIGAIA